MTPCDSAADALSPKRFPIASVEATTASVLKVMQAIILTKCRQLPVFVMDNKLESRPFSRVASPQLLPNMPAPLFQYNILMYNDFLYYLTFP